MNYRISFSEMNKLAEAANSKKTQSFLRRYAKAGYPIEKQQHFKDKETAALITFAKEEKIFFDHSIPVNDFISEGAEQKVYRFDDAHVLKTNQSIFLRKLA